MRKSGIKRIRFYNKGFNQVLSQTSGVVRSAAEEIASRAGDGFGVRMDSSKWSKSGQSTRPVAFVYAETEEAKRRNATEKTLQKAVG